ncbi:tetraketide alpha-pyrone reductase 1 [Cannabis sativa]|uniref:tetraketide alpha-pyrone reductase 1 n=1 Tax=Cannabis sativa TaxID=3483 RepID=UPI0029CA817F|nr:tetraketide alpha-pyrone reductase 1 [Cannabis sativa]
MKLENLCLRRKKMDSKVVELKGRVCVTGASGFLASWLVKRLLLSGYHVIGTVRDPGNEKKVGHLWKLEGAKERLELVKADLMEEGSFDEAIMGCHGVFHTASPVLKPSSDPKAEILQPAIDGTLNVLRSCKKNPSMRRVVLTSSSSTMRARDDFDPNIPLDELSWSSIELCEKLQIWYVLSKTLAEKAAWEFCNKNGIDLVTVLPSFLIGPSLPPTLCSTASDVLGLLKGETEKFQFHGRMGYVHIDDVATCHILVFEHKNANGRYLCSSTVLDIDELASFLSKRYPYLPIPKRFEQVERPYYEFNTSKVKSLGFEFKSISEMFEDCIASLKDQGYLN